MKPYLDVSPYAEDNGELIGLDPRKIQRADLDRLTAPKQPMKAIRAFCLECSGESEAEARKCVRYRCPLWPYRMGTNVFHAKAKTGPDNKALSSCEECGAFMSKKRNDARYCSDSCRVKAHYWKQKSP